jgi:hypothetical protein
MITFKDRVINSGENSGERGILSTKGVLSLPLRQQG